MDIIARIRTDFPTKFGIPRQSGLIDELKGTVVFEPAFRNADALRGLDGFSHIWLIWQFSESTGREWSPTVKPPRLGGNRRMGVFATRSPFRPNPIGLSCVRLEGIDYGTPQGAVLRVSGVDLMDQTPIYDIKPYLPYADCHPDALDGFAGEVRAAILRVLAQDPRPGYRHADDGRRYGVEFAGFDIRFTVKDGLLRVCEVVRLPSHP